MGHDVQATGLELWGGHECTVNRVGDRWFDQTVLSGHEHRAGDLALFAGLGIRRLRYPVLWERISPDTPDRADFRWIDARLHEIQRLGMVPIATLCHHGSGPRYTSLLRDDFAPGLARHAAVVAARYPWIEDYTPVNEPLTTARFSGLYGFWYPHARDEAAFWTALLNQIDATRLAMRAIRHVNPRARLIQTDDLGFTHASAPLMGEAAFQNERRWMGWDLLYGMVVPGHLLWQRLADHGLADRLRVIADDPCPPDIIGINHYLSSERLLDHRIEDHGGRSSADRAVGDSGGIALVDVSAVRSRPDAAVGLSGLVEQAWRRYRRPIAITECHNACTREEQARWFVDGWNAAVGLRRRGVDLRAVTAWSLLGAFDWDRMLTRVVGRYEAGVFDLRDDGPRPTMLARLLPTLAAGGAAAGPGLSVPGWWRTEREAWRPFTMSGDHGAAPPFLAIVAGDDLLTRLATDACEARGLYYRLVEAGRPLPGAIAPWAVLDARGIMSGGGDVVFGGRDIVHAVFLGPVDPSPVAATSNLLVIEHGPLFTANDDASLPARLLDAADAGGAVTDQGAWDGIYGPSLIDGVLDLLLDEAKGVVRFTRDVDLSSAEIARTIADITGSTASDGAPPRLVAAPSGPSHVPAIEVMLERFVDDRRGVQAARRHERTNEGRQLEVAD